MKTFLLIVVFSIGLSGCSNFSGKPEEFDIDPFVITLERYGCHGACKVYDLIIFKDGLVVFNGRKNTTTQGVLRSTINEAQIQQLELLFDKHKFIELEDYFVGDENNCDPKDSGYPHVTISLKKGEIYKEVVHYLGCKGRSESEQAQLKEMVSFEEKIDEIVNTSRWINGKDQ